MPKQKNSFFHASRRTTMIGLGLLCLVGMPLVGSPLAGCGGSTARRRDESGNRLVIPLDWPARTRALPQAANSVRVDVIVNNEVVSREVAQRPDTDAAITTNVTLNNVPGGNVTIQITAHPDDEAKLAEIARASIPYNITPGTTTLPTVTLQSTLTAITIVPDVSQISFGQGQEVVATPRNAQGEYILALASNYTWSSSAPNIISVEPNGDHAILRAVALGQAVITVTERESGLSLQKTITVTPLAETPTGSSYRYTLVADSNAEVSTFTNPVIDSNGLCWFVGTAKSGAKGVYSGNNGTLVRYADNTGLQFSDFDRVGDVSPNGQAVVFTATRRDGNTRGVFLLQNNVITQITSEAGDIRNIASDTLVNDAAGIAYVAQGDEGFNGSDTRNIYFWKGGSSRRVYQGASPSATASLLSLESDDSTYFRSSLDNGAVSRVTSDGNLTQNVTLPFDKTASAYSVIPQGTTVSAFGTTITPQSDYARRNRNGQITFLATSGDGRTLLLRADPVQ